MGAGSGRGVEKTTGGEASSRTETTGGRDQKVAGEASSRTETTGGRDQEVAEEYQ